MTKRKRSTLISPESVTGATSSSSPTINLPFKSLLLKLVKMVKLLDLRPTSSSAVLSDLRVKLILPQKISLEKEVFTPSKNDQTNLLYFKFNKNQQLINIQINFKCRFMFFELQFIQICFKFILFKNL
ncbi:hypothetical protein TTHERM_000837939 (macronuclear) [Tetrahymena thermophila SB210]|uniref:Uncharacterized protein n=1 Tax=Tetrahymena thermophila (strain SB210) TaxID=312017 RepID=W7XFQ8_TETTS|nr:hypothetical protein TTHERM_000837939 [Tetrahymena thermophila SB210]EWS71654.1 hypothetical protein TTHERM_000837939 [Tetrahymena thermophila SB210]|eukprot:XP_012655814.1 hypothetical protein TTHERM_000837939 [Tetrahymena thermophila SB210]